MSTAPSLLSVDDFAAKIKAKYPDYSDMDNRDLAQRIVAKHPEYKQSVNLDAPAKPALVPDDARISAPESGPVAWLDRQYNRMRDFMGADHKPAGDVIGGMALGPIRAAKGYAQAHEHPVRGINNMIGGIGQTVALPAAVMNPSTMAYAAPSVAAQHLTQSGLDAMGVDPEYSELSGNVAALAAGGAVHKAPEIMRSAKVMAKPFGHLPVVDKFVKTAQALSEVPEGLRDAWGLKDAPVQSPTASMRKFVGMGKDPVRPAPRQLGKGPTIVSSPDTSGNVPDAKIQPIASTTRAQRMGLLLPEATKSGPIELPQSSMAAPGEQEGVLPAARKLIIDTKTGKAANTQYLTRPMRNGELPPVEKMGYEPAQQYFIDKTRQSLEEPTATGLEGQEAADRFMADHNQQKPGAKKPSPVVNNASGESAASQEAINRMTSEKSQGIKRFKIDTRSGKETPLFGVDAVDVKPGPYERIVQRGPKGETTLDEGAKARPVKSAEWNTENMRKQVEINRAKKAKSAHAGDD